MLDARCSALSAVPSTGTVNALHDTELMRARASDHRPAPPTRNPGTEVEEQSACAFRASLPHSTAAEYAHLAEAEPLLEATLRKKIPAHKTQRGS